MAKLSAKAMKVLSKIYALDEEDQKWILGRLLTASTLKETAWQCDNCNAVFDSDDWPRECPKCDYYHCGDFDCCYGEGFVRNEEK
jgi:rubrerythrin